MEDQWEKEMLYPWKPNRKIRDLHGKIVKCNFSCPPTQTVARHGISPMSSALGE